MRKPLRILHLSSEYPPARVYGLGRWVHGLARAQAAQGDEVLVLTNSHGGIEDQVLQEGVQVHRIAFPSPPRPADSAGEVLQWNHCVLARLFDRLPVFQGLDLVLGHDWLTAVAGREAAALLGCPFVVTFHDEVVGKHYGVLGPETRFVRELEALTAHDATHLIANSRYVAGELVRHYGVDPTKVTAVPGGIDPALFELEHPGEVRAFRRALTGEEEPLYLYAGRLDPEKGLGVLAEAWPLVLRSLPTARLVVAGTGQLGSVLEEGALTERVRYLGYVGKEVLGYLYRAADVAVVPSLYEPYGLVALEAMLSGTALVCAETGGLKEIVRSEEEGLLVPAGDPLALARGMLALGRDPLLRRRLGEAAARRVRAELTWKRVAERTRAVYERALGQAPRLLAAPLPERPAPLVSVTIATKDAPAHFETALRSLFRRTDYPTLEAIVVDDGSGPAARDQIAALVAELANQGHAVRLVRNETPRRFSGAQNQAISLARGEYVCLLNDDTEVPQESEGWLRGLLWLLEERKAGTATPVTLLRDGRIYCAGAFGGGGHRLKGVLDGPGLQPEPRPTEWNNGACLLTRRRHFLPSEVGPLAEEEPLAHYGSDREWCLRLTARLGLGHWVHPIRLRHFEKETVRDPSAAYAASSETLLPASIVVVAWNGRELTEACLRSILDHTAPPFELVLVDNGSSDGTSELFQRLQDELGGGVAVQVLRNARNLGYPVAANQGARAARGRHVVLLNNDTRVRPGWLGPLLLAADSRPKVGVVTGKILNEDGTVQNAGGILHAPDGSFEIPFANEDRLAPTVTAPRELENAGGPCMLLTRSLLESLAADGRPLDEAYTPGYFEDSDLCLRAREAGFALLYEPGSEVYHRAKGTSEAVARSGEYDVWGQFQKNQRRFQTRFAEALSQDEERRSARPATRRRKILLGFNRSETTTAAYCLAALREEHEVITFGRGQDLDLGEEPRARELVAAAGGEVDLILAVEGENCFPKELEEAGCLSAAWLIDSHLHAHQGGWHFSLARRFDQVFLAQKDYLPAFEQVGVRAHWLPLACDPGVHWQPSPTGRRDLDVVFVGHLRPIHARLKALLERLRACFRVEVREGVSREDMARLFARAKVVWNCSVAGDLNVWVFEAMASGALLVSDRIANGLEELFCPNEHLLLYKDEDLEEVVARGLRDEPLRRELGHRAELLVRRHHTYRERMRQLVRTALASPAKRARAPMREFQCAVAVDGLSGRDAGGLRA